MRTMSCVIVAQYVVPRKKYQRLILNFHSDSLKLSHAVHYAASKELSNSSCELRRQRLTLSLNCCAQFIRKYKVNNRQNMEVGTVSTFSCR
mmetsp:Transcript_6803/g.12177  ORF Transcript_6803/g.12177 Transcript_6803/m.12177 type:complete len:91 (-) Transcript_6803:284-556(-)